jgi:hypothetical protein
MAKEKKKHTPPPLIPRTIKIRHFCPDPSWLDYCGDLKRKQSNAIRFAVQRFREGFNTKEVREKVAYLINYNVDELNNEYIDPKRFQSVPTDSYFIHSAVIKAEGDYKSAEERGQKTITFKQKAFDRYNKGEITKEQLKKERNFPIYSVGESNQKGNRKYNFLSYNTIEFKPNRNDHFTFHLSPSRNQVKYLKTIYYLARNEKAPITIMLDEEYIYLAFDIDRADTPIRKEVEKNKVLGIDLNPNSFGFVIKNETEIFKAEKLDFMDLRLYTRKGFASDSDEKKYLNNKKTHEVIQAAYYIADIAEENHCQAIAIENLDNMIARTSNRHFNRSVNNDFKKKLFKLTLQKVCSERGIRYIEILAAYTSFFGHVKYNQILGDPCSAAACVADAGILELTRADGEKRIAWFNQLKIDKSLYIGNTYLARWNATDLNFTSIKELYESIKKLFSLSKGNMYESYHISYPEVSTSWFKSRRSSVRQIGYI